MNRNQFLKLKFDAITINKRVEEYIILVKERLECNMSEEDQKHNICFMYTEEEIDKNVDFYRWCMRNKISPYLSFYHLQDYINGKLIIKNTILIEISDDENTIAIQEEGKPTKKFEFTEVKYGECNCKAGCEIISRYCTMNIPCMPSKRKDKRYGYFKEIKDKKLYLKPNNKETIH